MSDHPSHQSPAHQAGAGTDGAERARALAEVERDYPGWHAWSAVFAGIVYARRPRSSPPLVVRATTTEGLRQAIEGAEARPGLR
jgi:hypothetical protein